MERGAWRAAEPMPRVLTPSMRPSSGWQSHARDRDWIFKALCGVLNSIVPSQPWQGSLCPDLGADKRKRPRSGRSIHR